MDTLKEKYNQALVHKQNHKSCGGEPYKNFDMLFEIVNQYKEPIHILEVGTAVGFTTFILQNTKDENINFVDTIEMHPEHIELAKENIKKWSGYTENEVGGDISKINFFVGEAKDILPTISPGKSGGYDLIFFDGYGAKLIFYKDFERLLNSGGLLITANQHLKSTEQEYFKELTNNLKWEFILEFDDTKVYKKLT